jgi:hypothetical protein
VVRVLIAPKLSRLRARSRHPQHEEGAPASPF